LWFIASWISSTDWNGEGLCGRGRFNFITHICFSICGIRLWTRRFDLSI